MCLSKAVIAPRSRECSSGVGQPGVVSEWGDLGGVATGRVQPDIAPWLPPEILEPIRRQLGIAHGVLNVPVAEIGLQGARVVAGICQGEAATVAEHVRVAAPRCFRWKTSCVLLRLKDNSCPKRPPDPSGDPEQSWHCAWGTRGQRRHMTKIEPHCEVIMSRGYAWGFQPTSADLHSWCRVPPYIWSHGDRLTKSANGTITAMDRVGSPGAPNPQTLSVRSASREGPRLIPKWAALHPPLLTLPASLTVWRSRSVPPLPPHWPWPGSCSNQAGSSSTFAFFCKPCGDPQLASIRH